jgi:hypothetical protein
MTAKDLNIQRLLKKGFLLATRPVIQGRACIGGFDQLDPYVLRAGFAPAETSDIYLSLTKNL